MEIITRSEILALAQAQAGTSGEVRAAVMAALAPRFPAGTPKTISDDLLSRFSETISRETMDDLLETVNPNTFTASADQVIEDDTAVHIDQSVKYYWLQAIDTVTDDTGYLGEVFGIGDEDTGRYFLMAKNEDYAPASPQSGYKRVGLILTPQMMDSILDHKAKLEGYDFFGAYKDGSWQFYKCCDEPDYMTFNSFSLTKTLFSRNAALFEASEMGNKYAIVIGSGSVGSQVAMQLARAGVGRFVLVDSDILEIHNICRHELGCRDLGRKKVLALKEALENINPLVEVRCFDGMLEDAPMELFQLEGHGIMVGTADSRACDANANDLAAHLGIPFVSLGCWSRCAAGEIFYWAPGSDMILYREAFRNMLTSERSVSHQDYFGTPEDASKMAFEPGTSIDMAYTITVGIMLCRDLLNSSDEGYIPRVADYLTNFTMVCCCNKPEIGGEKVAMFPHPLYVSNNIHMKKVAAHEPGTDAGAPEAVGEN